MTGDGVQSAAAARVLSVLRGRRPPAALAMELAALLGPSARGTAAELAGALVELEAARAILTQDHSAPDPHLEGFDLRVVALVPDQPGDQAVETARGAADAIWSDWLRQFLATHRCT